MPIQIVIRDMYGSVVLNQAFPNLMMASMCISLFIKVFNSPIGQVILLSPNGKNFEKTVFKLYEEDGGKVLKSNDGQKILLPEPEEGMEAEFEEYDEDDDDESFGDEFFGGGTL